MHGQDGILSYQETRRQDGARCPPKVVNRAEVAKMKAILIMLALTIVSAASAESLNEILGYKPTDKLLIINADDAGNSHAANVAIMEMFEKGAITSSTIMVPCSWVPEIAEFAKTKGEFGVHLTHTSEWKKCRWRPLTNAPGLTDPQGYLWPEETDVYAHATAEAARDEARAQIGRALAAGIDVTHIDSHMGTMQLKPDFAAQYLALAKEYRLPLRMAPAEMMTSPEYKPMFDNAREMGLLFPDDLVWDGVPRWAQKKGEPRADYLKRVLLSLRPGVTEMYIHPAAPTDEIKAMTGSWADRAADYEFFAHDPSFRQIVKEQGIILIGYRALRDAQRARAGR